MGMLLSPKDGDWTGVRKNFHMISSTKLGPISTPTFTGLALTGLTASRLMATNASKVLVSSDLASWVTGVANEIDITDDADGTITIGIVNPLIVAKGGTGLATITNHGILLGSGTGAVTPLAAATNGQLPIGSTGADPVLAGLTGTANQVTVTNGAGTITLSLPQNIHTGASPAFSTLELSESLSIKQVGFAKYGIIYFIGSEFASNRELTIDLNDGDRILDLNSVRITLADWFNQEVKNTSSPTFANITVSTNINGLNLTSSTPGDWNITDGTSQLQVTAGCLLDQNVSQASSVNFGASLRLTNASGDTALQFIDTLANDNAFQILHDTSADSLIISSYYSSAWHSAFEIEARGDVVINKGGFQGAGQIVQNMKGASGAGITNIFSSGIDLGNGVGQIGDGLSYLFKVENAGGVKHDAAKWIVKWADPTAGSEDTTTIFQNMVAGSFVDALTLDGSNANVNGAISSATLVLSAAGPTDNLDVSGVNTIFVNTSNNSVILGGTVGGVDGQILHIVIIDKTNNFTIEHNEGTGNQDFILHSEADDIMITGYGGWTFVNYGGNHWCDLSHAPHT